MLDPKTQTELVKENIVADFYGALDAKDYKAAKMQVDAMYEIDSHIALGLGRELITNKMKIV